MTEPFVFLVGCGRSGTTLLAVLLDSHPAVSVPAETGGFIFRFCLGPESWDPDGHVADDPARATAVHGRQTEPYDRETARRLLAELGSEHRYLAWRLDEDELVEHVLARGVADRTAFIRAVYEFYAASQGKVRFGDKTPDHVVALRTLAALFPDGVFVHLIRDGRDVALSMRDTTWGANDVASAAAHWADRVTRGAEAGTVLGPERYLELRYEALVSEPERQLRRLCAFADLEFDPAMLDHTGAAKRQIAMSPVPSEDKSTLRPISSGLRDWRRDMSATDVETFESVAGPTLRRFGY